MGLKFERTDNLDKLFESFAVDPEKTVAPKEEIDRFSKTATTKRKEKRQETKVDKFCKKKTYQPNFYGRV